MNLKSRRAEVGLISLSGPITETSAINFSLALRALPSTSPALRMLIIRISSDGGSLGAAQTIAESLEVLRRELGVVSLALIIDIAASAAFYAAQAADIVVASEAATLGNAGSILRIVGFEDLIKRLGISYQSIASGFLKDCLGPSGILTPEQASALTEMVDDNAGQFFRFLAARRQLTDGVAAMLKTGALFSGRYASEHGLVDRLGGLFTAVQMCGERMNISAPQLQMLDDATSQSNDLRTLGLALFRRLSRLAG
jgi:protease-4